MIKGLAIQQRRSKHAYFAKRLTDAIVKIDVQPSPIAVTRAFNKHSKVAVLKPHTVRKWLLGMTQPRTEILLLLAEWLNLEPQELLTEKQTYANLSNKVSFEFNFTDQEMIAKYLSMAVKQKVTVRVLIDDIAEKHR